MNALGVAKSRKLGGDLAEPQNDKSGICCYKEMYANGKDPNPEEDADNLNALHAGP